MRGKQITHLSLRAFLFFTSCFPLQCQALVKRLNQKSDVKKMVIRCSSSSLSLGSTAAALLARRCRRRQGRAGRCRPGREGSTAPRTQPLGHGGLVRPPSADLAQLSRSRRANKRTQRPRLQSGRPAPTRYRVAGHGSARSQGSSARGLPRPGRAPSAPPRLARPRPPPLTQLAAGLLQLLNLVLQEQHGHPEHQHRQQLQLGRQHNPEQPHEQQQQRRPPGITT